MIDNEKFLGIRLFRFCKLQNLSSSLKNLSRVSKATFTFFLISWNTNMADARSGGSQNTKNIHEKVDKMLRKSSPLLSVFIVFLILAILLPVTHGAVIRDKKGAGGNFIIFLVVIVFEVKVFNFIKECEKMSLITKKMTLPCKE